MNTIETTADTIRTVAAVHTSGVFVAINYFAVSTRKSMQTMTAIAMVKTIAIIENQ